MNCFVILLLACRIGCTYADNGNTISSMEQLSPLKQDLNWSFFLSTLHECIRFIFSSNLVQFLFHSPFVRELLISITGMCVANTLKYRVLNFQKLSNQILALFAILLVNLNYLSHFITYCAVHPGFRLLLIVLVPYTVTIMRVAMIPGIGNIDALKLSCYKCLLYAFPRTKNRTFRDIREWLDAHLTANEEALNKRLETLYIKNGIIEVPGINSVSNLSLPTNLPCYGSC